ncbi:MAG TPA: EamA family transporter [Anaerolineae bacterium]|nr:EamA family transporter [Anaerolineae bacterium]
MPRKSAPRWLVVLAFAAIYFIWGSTYLFIGFAVITIPPHIVAGTRFFIAGILLYAFLRWRGVPTPKLIHWRSAAIIGILLLALANGSVAWAETMVPTGLAALIVALVPLWIVLLDWFRPNGNKPRGGVLGGVSLGLVGMMLLIGPSALGLDRALNPIGLAILIPASISWAIGSVYSQHAPLPESPLMLTAMEMLAGSTALFVMSFALGEWSHFQIQAISPKSWIAMGYLTFVGSLLAFSAYVFLLQVSTPAKVLTYAYVNPVVAVFLGWALNGEQITPVTLVASAIIVISVAIITYFQTRPTAIRARTKQSLESELAARVPVSE